jgi:hypothetical protein
VKPTIFRVLAEAKKSIGAVGKNDTNQIQKFKFRGIDAVVNAVAPVFNDLGVITVPEVLEHEYETVVIGAKQTQMGHVRLVVKYHFYGPEGDCVTATVASESMDSGDKATPKAMSVAFRTALLQVLNLPTDEPDPDSETYERSPRTQAGKPTRPVALVADERPWNERIYACSSLDELRNVWKEAGVAAAFKDSTVTTTGEKLTVQDLLYKRSDELSLKSDSGALVGVGAN